MGGLRFSKKEKMNYYFDLDNTLIRSRHLKPYLHTVAGREFLIKNPSSVNTEVVNPRLVDLIAAIKEKAIVVTNSPQEYAEGMLKKHKFPTIQVIGSADKPCSNLRLQKNSIYIGDEPSDILFAHEQRISGLAYLEASFFPRGNVSRSQPTAIAKTIHELEKLLAEGINYVPFNQGNFFVLTKITDEEIPIHFLVNYHAWGSIRFKSSESPEVLAYKKSKSFSAAEINAQQRDSYFFNGRIKQSNCFLTVVSDFYTRVHTKIKQLNLKGTTEVIALPNSMPEYAYLFDVNHWVARKYNGKQGERVMRRIKPVREAHVTGLRNPAKHIGNLALDLQNLDLNVDNIVLFDDISTTGSQFQAGVSLLRAAGYKNNAVGLALGKTFEE
jgi:hypothetical protein